jgi:hypothetical protein
MPAYSTLYADITIFNSLPPSMTILKNDKVKFKAAVRKYLHIHLFYSVYEFFMCKDDLYYCFCTMFLVFYTVNVYV